MGAPSSDLAASWTAHDLDSPRVARTSFPGKLARLETSTGAKTGIASCGCDPAESVVTWEFVVKKRYLAGVCSAMLAVACSPALDSGAELKLPAAVQSPPKWAAPVALPRSAYEGLRLLWAAIEMADPGSAHFAIARCNVISSSRKAKNPADVQVLMSFDVAGENTVQATQTYELFRARLAEANSVIGFQEASTSPLEHGRGIHVEGLKIALDLPARAPDKEEDASARKPATDPLTYIRSIASAQHVEIGEVNLLHSTSVSALGLADETCTIRPAAKDRVFPRLRIENFLTLLERDDPSARVTSITLARKTREGKDPGDAWSFDADVTWRRASGQ